MSFSRRKLLSFIMPASIVGILTKTNDVIAQNDVKTSHEINHNNNSTTSDDNVIVSNLFKNSVDQTQNEINQQRVSVKSFGAKGEYIPGQEGSDDTKAFQLAADYCSENNGRTLIIPAGNYLITDTISSLPFYMEGESGSSRIYIKGMTGKVVFDMSKPANSIGRIIGCKDIEWVTENSYIDSVLKGPTNNTEYNKSFLRYIIVNNFCHGGKRNDNAYSFCWNYSAAAWFRIGDCVGAIIEGNNIHGKFDIQKEPNSQFDEAAFVLNADDAIMSARMSNNNIGPIKTAIKIINNVFITAHDNDIFGTLDGIAWSGTSKFNEPKFYANNINCQRNGIICEGASYLNFTNNTIRRHRKGWKNASSTWHGVMVSNATDIKITDNTIQPDESDGTFKGDCIAINLENVSISSINNNFVGSGCSTGINLINCAGLNLNNIISAQNKKSDTLFLLSKNSRFISVGLYSLVSTFAGKILKKDETIKAPVSMFNNNFDLQSNADVVFNMTRVNAENDMKQWRTTVGTNQLSRSIVSDDDKLFNYEVITRTADNKIEKIALRAQKININNGPDLITGQGDPNGRIEASRGSLYLRTDQNAKNSLYVKESRSGKFGWKPK